jgi:hypothetical protein
MLVLSRSGRGWKLFAMTTAICIPPVSHEYAWTLLIHGSPFLGGGGLPPVEQEIFSYDGNLGNPETAAGTMSHPVHSGNPVWTSD